MNRRPPGFKLSKLIEGFLQYKAAEALSPHTLESYESHLKKWASHMGEVDLASIIAQDLRAYLAWLRTDYKPCRFSGDDHPLAPKTIRNVVMDLDAVGNSK